MQAIESTAQPFRAPVPLSGDITILQPPYESYSSGKKYGENQCDDLCLSLLYAGKVSSVTMGPSSSSSRVLTYRPQLPPITYAIEQRSHCQDPSLVKSPHWDGWKTRNHFGYLMQAVKVKIASGKCLVARQEPVLPPGIRIVLDQKQLDSQGPDGRGLKPVVRTIEVWNGPALLGRTVDIEAAKLALPIFLIPEEHGMSMGPWRLDRTTRSRALPINDISRVQRATGWDIALPQSGLEGS